MLLKITVWCAEKATETEQAVGRLVGALCAITAKDDDAESAMLASWISQVRIMPSGQGLALTAHVSRCSSIMSRIHCYH